MRRVYPRGFLSLIGCVAGVQYAFGQKRGLWFVIPFQLIVMIGLAIVYCVTGGVFSAACYLTAEACCSNLRILKDVVV